ncbi:MAG: transporter substrate-binding protein [Haloplasmataceae bacterium]|jgi:ABC-type amino acid transport substrate-binding protein|nr:transporter substrate-binding protein [Haloplasmataceae bacterium]
MKKLTTLLLAITFSLILSACTYKGNFSYFQIDALEFGIPTGYAIAFPKESTLTEHFNVVLNEMKNDGTLSCLQSHWVTDESNDCYNNIDFTSKKYTIAHSGNGQELDVITSSGYPGFEELDLNGNLSGYDIDLAKFIAKELNYTLKWEDAGFDRVIASLANEQVDFAIAAITPNDERKENIDFSTEYFTESYTVAVFRESDNFNSVDEMKGKTIAALSATVQAELVDHLYKEDRVRKVITLEYSAGAMQSLKTNKIDVFFVEKTIADELLEEYNKK